MWWLAGWALAAPGLRPLYAVEHACLDPRYPALAGSWVVACGPDGQVDRAISLVSGAELRLPFASEAPGLGPGAIYAAGPAGGLALLADGQVRGLEELTRVTDALVAPPATDGRHVAIAAADHVQAFLATDRQRRRIEARPAGWYAPALAWPWVAWVEDAGADGEDVRACHMERGDAPVTLAGGPGYQRHVVGDGHWLAWVEEDAVVIWDTVTDARTRHPAITGFHAPISLSDGVACWETRDGPDIDIACSDGLMVRRAGDQRWPSRSGPWLLFREDGRSWLLSVGTP